MAGAPVDPSGPAIPRNVFVLALCQALGLAGASLVILVGGLLGAELAPVPDLVTAPIALLVVGTALGAMPAARLMRRFGRRRGFITGAFIGVLAALTGARATGTASFTTLCLASGLIGLSTAFVQQYRFAAIESVAPQRAGTAVSIVLLGGVAAGLIGPWIADTLRSTLAAEYSGSFLGIGCLYLAVIALLSSLSEPALATSGLSTPASAGRSVRELLAQRDLIVAVAAATVGAGTMSFIMTATPVSMHSIDGHSVTATARIIQSHAVGMYLPSLFTGAIIAALGPRRTMLAGIGALAASIVGALSGHAFVAYWVALVLLGVGWNFLFVGGTVLLSSCYRPEERFRAQAINDSLVFSVQALAAVSAGEALHAIGWSRLVLVPVPALALMLGLIALSRTPRPSLNRIHAAARLARGPTDPPRSPP